MLHEQDLYILLKLFVTRNPHWTFSSLSQSLLISTSQLHLGLSRAEVSGLYCLAERRVNRKALAEFILHGVRYCFPVVQGPLTMGIATSFAAPPLRDKLIIEPGSPIPVWPDVDGDSKGYAIEPLHAKATEACKRDPTFHEVLALVDALREGRARERKLASEELANRFGYWD